MPWMIVILGTLYMVTFIAMKAVGLRVTVPLSFVMVALSLFAPLAWFLVSLARRAESQPWFQSRRGAAFAVVAGLAILMSYQYTSVLYLGFVLGALLPIAGMAWWRADRQSKREFLATGFALFLGYGAVWNMNYLAARYIGAHTFDPQLLELEGTLFSWLLGVAQTPGMYPLIHHSLIVKLLENAYGFLYTELFIVLFLLRNQVERAELLITTFCCYFVGVLCFLLFPAYGPTVITPRLLNPAMHGGDTHSLLQLMIRELRATVMTPRELRGFSYFGSLPSMHVAMAVLMQVYLWRKGPAFWSMLPINLLMILSTVVLGWHYAIDVLTGLVLAVVACVVQQPVASLIDRCSIHLGRITHLREMVDSLGPARVMNLFWRRDAGHKAERLQVSTPTRSP